MDERTALDERYANSVLIRLHDVGGKAKLSDFMDIVTAYTTLVNLMGALSDDGLVKMSRVTRPYKTNYAELTDLGWRVAGKLVAASKILAGEEPDQETNYDLSPQGRGAVKHGGDE